MASLGPGGIQVDKIGVEVTCFTAVIFDSKLLNFPALVSYLLPAAHTTGGKLKASLRLDALLHIVFACLRESAFRRNKVIPHTNLQLLLKQSDRLVLRIVRFRSLINMGVCDVEVNFRWRLPRPFTLFLDHLW